MSELYLAGQQVQGANNSKVSKGMNNVECDEGWLQSHMVCSQQACL